jgi:hypothetical protein
MRFAIVALLLVACSTDDNVAGPPDGSHEHDAGRDAGQDASAPDAVIIHEPSGLPCDVAGVLARECTVCHSQPIEGGAPVSLLTLADLTSIVPGTSITMAAYALERMMDQSMPTPPSTPATSAEIAIMQSWINAGMPAGTSACTPASPYDGAPTCTSTTMWTSGNQSSPLMHPGTACIGCHASTTPVPSPVLTMAGTVYRTVREPDDCNGVTPSATDPITVTVLDFDNRMISATVNAAGNFFSTDPIRPPIQYAIVTRGSQSRVMASGQASADCNSCHTEAGVLGAPGRIVAP